MLHSLKLHVWPECRSAAQWHQETGIFLDDAAFFPPSMRQRINLEALYGKALRRAASAADDCGPARRLPDACPCTLDVLLLG